MIEFKPRVWRALGFSALAVVGLAACQPGGEQGSGEGAKSGASAQAGEGEGASVTPPPPPPAEAAATGESGEAGISDAYSQTPPASQLGLRINHINGFLLVARKSYEAGQKEEASILVSQGLLEVYTPNVRVLDSGAPGYEEALDAVVKAIDTGKTKEDVLAAFDAAEKLAASTTAASKASPTDLINGMLSISTGLYSGVVSPLGNDPIEYQHAQGAALSAKAVFEASKSELSKKDPERTETLGKDIDALLALYPAVTMPEAPASVAALTGAASRAQLVLSGLR